MTELASFLASLYASVTEAELQSRRHGEARLAELLAAGDLSDDDSVPVYHASDVAVTLDVSLATEDGEDGPVLHVTEDRDDDTSLSFTIDLLDLVDRSDLPEDDADGTPVDPDEPPVDDGEDDSEDSDGEDDSGEDDGDYSDGEDDGEGKYPVELVDGIGPKRAHRLREAGVRWVEQFVELPAEKVAEIVSQDGETVAVEEAQQWLVRATHLLARERYGSERRKPTDPDESGEAADRKHGERREREKRRERGERGKRGDER